MTGAVSIDARKAFYIIDHACILSKFKFYRIESKDPAWFESFLFSRKQFLPYHGNKFEAKTLSSGMPEGSNLRSLLFVMPINDIEFQPKKNANNPIRKRHCHICGQQNSESCRYG